MRARNAPYSARPSVCSARRSRGAAAAHDHPATWPRITFWSPRTSLSAASAWPRAPR